MIELEKAQLLFLDAIERRQGKMAEAIDACQEELKAALDAAVNGIVTAIRASSQATVAAMPKPSKPTEIDMQPLVEKLVALNNSQAVLFDKLISEIKVQTERTIQSHSELLDAINKPKKWKFNIDRNHSTKLIQDIIVEAV